MEGGGFNLAKLLQALPNILDFKLLSSQEENKFILRKFIYLIARGVILLTFPINIIPAYLLYNLLRLSVYFDVLDNNIFYKFLAFISFTFNVLAVLNPIQIYVDKFKF